jgi:hypothetical protein
VKLTLSSDIPGDLITAAERWASLKDTLIRQARALTVLGDRQLLIDSFNVLCKSKTMENEGRQLFINTILALPDTAGGEGAAGLLSLLSDILGAEKNAREGR